MILDPRPMNVIGWTSQMTLQLDRYGPIGQLNDPVDWRRWARNVIDLIDLSSDTVNPDNYDNWLEWAIRFSQAAEFKLT